MLRLAAGAGLVLRATAGDRRSMRSIGYRRLFVNLDGAAWACRVGAIDLRTGLSVCRLSSQLWPMYLVCLRQGPDATIQRRCSCTLLAGWAPAPREMGIRSCDSPPSYAGGLPGHPGDLWAFAIGNPRAMSM